MARTDTLPHFLTDVADAIRAKAGTSETIQASSFDTAISNIPSGGTSPTNVSELNIAIQDMLDTFSNNILAMSNTYNPIVNNNVTLYTPNADYTYYVIRYRGPNRFQIVWLPKTVLQFKSSSTITTSNFWVTTSATGFVQSVSYKIFDDSIDGYGSSEYTTLENTITAIQSAQTSYSKFGSSSSWGYTEYSVDYKVPCTNTTMYDANGNSLNGQRISLNETIQVIE